MIARMSIRIAAEVPRALRPAELTLVKEVLVVAFEETLDILFDADDPAISSDTRKRVKRILADMEERASREPKGHLPANRYTEGELPL